MSRSAVPGGHGVGTRPGALVAGAAAQVREYQIHKALAHPRVVALLDIFEIDTASFATVLEVAAGGDLAWHLQLHKARPPPPRRCLRRTLLPEGSYWSVPTQTDHATCVGE